MCDRAKLGVNVFVDEAIPLGQGVQSAEQPHHLFSQSAAVGGSQGSLWPGPPLPQCGF